MRKAFTLRCNLVYGEYLETRPKLFVTIALCAFFFPAVAGAQSISPPTGVKESARSIVNLLVKENFSGVRSRFSEVLKDKLSESQIREGWKSVTSQLGDFKKQQDALAKRDQGFDVIDIRCEFEKASVIVRVVFDAQGLIDGLWVAPETASAGASGEAISAAKRVVEMLVRENFSGVRQWFNSQMKGGLSEAELQSTWQKMITQVGPFKNQIDIRSQKEPVFQVVDVRCQFEKAVVIVRVSFDPQGQIGGLWLLPGS